jgi:exo-beta-1,3-glucanase (GH17 family)
MRLASHGGTQYKTATDWLTSFTAAKALGFNAVRIYSVSDTQFTSSPTTPHEPLPDILAAATTTNMDVLLGLYLDAGLDPSTQQKRPNSRLRFEREFAALKNGLLSAAGRAALDSVIGISVGNEDLYEGRQDAAHLAGLIAEVQEFVRKELGACVPVGHTETWGEIVDEDNKAVSFSPPWQNCLLHFSLTIAGSETIVGGNVDVDVEGKGS